MILSGVVSFEADLLIAGRSRSDPGTLQCPVCLLRIPITTHFLNCGVTCPLSALHSRAKFTESEKERAKGAVQLKPDERHQFSASFVEVIDGRRTFRGNF
jgi:hypothetical protein